MNWQYLDMQMKPFYAKLEREVKLAAEVTAKLATTVAADVQSLSLEQKTQIKDASPISLQDRLSELQAFQGWMDHAIDIKNNPSIARAQVMTQNYICFVYLPEACFRVLARVCPARSSTRKCAKFLSNNPVRLFRNAIAHANWTYRSDFQAIIYWTRKGNDPNEPLERFEVEQTELTFWQALSRCVAYATYSSL